MKFLFSLMSLEIISTNESLITLVLILLILKTSKKQ